MTERDAVSALITIARDREQARQLSAAAKKFKASADANTAAVLAFMDSQEPKLTQLEDLEHELTVTRWAKPKARKLDIENLPDDLLVYLAERGGVSAVLGVIDKLPESTIKDRVMRFVGPGGETIMLSFGDGEEEEAA